MERHDEDVFPLRRLPVIRGDGAEKNKRKGWSKNFFHRGACLYMIIMASPNEKKRYRSFTASAYAFMVRS